MNFNTDLDSGIWHSLKMNNSNHSTPTRSVPGEDPSEYSPIINQILFNELDGTSNESGLLCQYTDDGDGNTTSASGCDEDIYAQLAQKDHDLMLAAQLGKALLDKNEELTRRNEQLNEEYLLKVEELTQEKHAQKLKLENLKQEYETTVRELQNDINFLHEALEDKQYESKNGNREKSHIIEELHVQNEKLADQLRKSYETEKELRAQVRTLHDEMDLRRHTTQDSIHYLENLRSELTSLKERKMELETKIRHLTNEKTVLTEHYDEAQDRMKEIEKVCAQQLLQIKDLQKSVEELQDRNSQLQTRLPNSNHVSMTSLEGGSNLYSELNMSGLAQAMSTESLDDPGAVKIGQQNTYGMMNFYGSHDPSMFEDDDIEYDDIDVCIINSKNNQAVGDYNAIQPSGHLGAHSPDLISQHTLTSNVSSNVDDDEELRQEILEVYRQLHHLVMDLRGEGDQWSPETLQIEDMKAGSLLSVLKELHSLVEELTSSAIDKEAIDALSLELKEQEEHNLTRLKLNLITAETDAEKYKTQLTYKEEQLNRREEQVVSLSRKLQQEQEVNSAVIKERDLLLDKKLNLTRDDVIDKARLERDRAIDRKNKTELELAKARLDSAHLDRQLMETVQQKLDLSQQLELWQVDMQELIDKQVSKRMKDDKKKEQDLKNKNTPKSPSPRKRFSLFRR